MAEGGDRNRGAIFNGDMTTNRMWTKRVKDTGILGEVGDVAAVKTHYVWGEPMVAVMPTTQCRRRYHTRHGLARRRRRGRCTWTHRRGRMAGMGEGPCRGRRRTETRRRGWWGGVERICIGATPSGASYEDTL
jgi:hypothetical protein